MQAWMKIKHTKEVKSGRYGSKLTTVCSTCNYTQVKNAHTRAALRVVHVCTPLLCLNHWVFQQNYVSHVYVPTWAISENVTLMTIVCVDRNSYISMHFVNKRSCSQIWKRIDKSYVSRFVFSTFEKNWLAWVSLTWCVPSSKFILPF